MYAYDNLYQLTQVWYGANSTVPASITTYNDQQTYVLDGLGNRLTVAFDQRGNTLTDGISINSYGYDQLNRQISVTVGISNAEYIYDAMGRRIAKAVDGTTTYYLYDKQFRVIEERITEATWNARYTYGAGIDEPLLMERGGSSYTYHRDALGSVTEITDNSGNVATTYEYEGNGRFPHKRTIPKRSLGFSVKLMQSCEGANEKSARYLLAGFYEVGGVNGKTMGSGVGSCCRYSFRTDQ